MLSDKLREGAQGKIFKLLFWIIILSFIFAGVGGYLIPRLNTDPVTVGDYKISANEWNEQYNRETQQMHRIYGAQASRLLENQQYVAALRSSVLESMIDNVALSSAVFSSDVRIGDEQVREVIRRTPAFQRDGRFDNDLYLASVRNMGMNPEYFGEQMRLSIMTDFVRNPAVNTGALPLPYELEQTGRLLTQARTVSLYSLDLTRLKQELTASDAEVQSWYDDHQADYMAPANVKFTYLVLDSNELKKTIKYTDDDLENYLSLNQDDFVRPEHRSVSQILVKADAADAAERIAAIDKALAAGEDFAKLAAQYSDDPGAKDSHGSLGSVAQGDLAPNLDAAAFALAEGAVSQKIQDSFGTHYIKVDKIEKAAVPPFAEIKEQVAQAYLNDQARELYQNQLNTLSDLSFENPDSLDVTAQALGLAVQECTGLDQGDAKAVWPLNTPALQEAAFTEDNITSGVNSPVITISDTVSAVINIHDYREAQLRPLTEVKALVQDAVLEHKAQEQGKDMLIKFAKDLKQDPNAPLPQDAVLTADLKVERGSQAVDPAFGQAIFAIPQSGDAQYCVGPNKGRETLAVLKSVSSVDSKALSEYENLMRAQLVQYGQQKLQRALYAGARAMSDIEYNEEAINMINQQNSDAE